MLPSARNPLLDTANEPSKVPELLKTGVGGIWVWKERIIRHHHQRLWECGEDIGTMEGSVEQ